jgi:hypothetical protein
MVFELACLVLFVGPAGVFEGCESPAMDPLRDTAGRQGALTWYRKSRTNDFGGGPVIAVSRLAFCVCWRRTIRQRDWVWCKVCV